MPDPANKKQLTGEQELKLAIDSSYEIGMTPVTKQEMEDLRQIIFA